MNFLPSNREMIADYIDDLLLEIDWTNREAAGDALLELCCRFGVGIRWEPSLNRIGVSAGDSAPLPLLRAVRKNSQLLVEALNRRGRGPRAFCNK